MTQTRAQTPAQTHTHTHARALTQAHTNTPWHSQRRASQPWCGGACPQGRRCPHPSRRGSAAARHPQPHWQSPVDHGAPPPPASAPASCCAPPEGSPRTAQVRNREGNRKQRTGHGLDNSLGSNPAHGRTNRTPAPLSVARTCLIVSKRSRSRASWSSRSRSTSSLILCSSADGVADPLLHARVGRSEIRG